MKIALVNLINYTIDVPKSLKDLFGLTSTKIIPTDKNTSIVELGAALADLDHEVFIYISDVFKPETSYVKEKLHIQYLPTKLKFIFPPAFIPFCPSLLRELSREDFDVVLTMDHFQSGTLMSLIMSLLKKTKVVIWQDLNNFPRFPGDLVIKFYNYSLGLVIMKYAKIIIPKSDSARNFLLKCRVDPQKIHGIIPTGVNSQIYMPLTNVDIKDFPIKDKKQKMILSVARLHPQKGLEYLIAAMPDVIKECPDSILLIRGDGTEFDKLQSQIKGLSLESSVFIHQCYYCQEQMVKLYNSCFLTVLASIYETFGFVILESLACGKPVIVTDIDGPREIVKGKEVGYIVPPRSPKELADAIINLLKDDDERSRMGMNGRKLILSEYDWKIIAQRFIAAFNE